MSPVKLVPRLTEKSYGLSAAKKHVYVFDVDADANVHTIKRAVEAEFKVGVSSVNVVNVKGKAKRTIANKGRKVYQGRTSAAKKAYVTLKVGDSLPFFASLEEEEKKQQQTQAKLEKAMEKQDAKETKKEKRSILRGKRTDQEEK
jgi:large subunit ribosomal protein L23